MSWTMSPIQTPSKARRSCQSDYETAGEDEDSDSSLYYSMTDMERTLENKENSINKVSNSAKRLPKGGSAGTPLLRKTLQKNLIDIQAPMTPRQKVNKQVSFDFMIIDPPIEPNCPEAVATPPASETATGTNAKIDTEPANASGMTDDVCDITVVETGATAVGIGAAAKSVSFLGSAIKVIVTDFDEPDQAPKLIAKMQSEVKTKKNNRLSVNVTKKTIKTANTNASVRNRRQQLAEEAKRAPTKDGRTSIYKRSSMYQPRKSSGRRSIEAMIVAKVNKTLLETEAAFAEDAASNSVPVEEPTTTGENHSSTSNGQSASVTSSVEEHKPSCTSIQNTKPSKGPKELQNKIAVKEPNPPRKMPVPSNVTQATSVINAIKQSRLTVAPVRQSIAAVRKSFAPVRKSVAPVRKSIAPRLSIFSTSTSSSAAVRAQRRQTKNHLQSAKSDATVAKSEATTTKTSSAESMPPTNSKPRTSIFVKMPATSTSTATSSKAGEFRRPADVRLTSSSSDANAFKCLQCKKTFNNELQLRVHTNNFHNLTKKQPSSTGTSNASNALKCRFCDKQFDKMFGLNKHMQENCTKIQPAERKRMFADQTDRNKFDASDLISESQSKGDGQRNTSTADETRLRLSKMSLGHSGVYRTPTKSIKCNICNAVFMSCVLFAEHSLLHGK